MKVIIPLAGKGTRLRPHTHITPKPMLKVAGKPVMAYILDDLKALGRVSEIIYITGHLKEKVEEFARENYDFPSVFVEQKVQDGTAGAVKLAQPHVDEPVLIIFVDTIFDADLAVVNNTDADGIIWTKEVEDYQRFGVVVTDADGYMTKIVEKPKTPISKRANIGLYYIRDWKLMYEGIDWVLSQPKNQGEYFLTDAFQYMIEKGARIKVLDVAGWFDAGKIDTLLETNRVMLERSKERGARSEHSTARITQPVRIEEGARVNDSNIGPNVTVGAGSVVEGCTLRDTIVGSGATLRKSTLRNSLIGDAAIIENFDGEVTVADHSEVRGVRG
ncbi:MAG TPA: sugar phosphate nucleotidyltransferase [Gemmatimonadaceae bacterium]|nr:sugar phosphate nucleotidyltransferase [Gemmatimonadaceae bacterium]